MSGRMTDKRLAELRRWYGVRPVSAELLDALLAERAEVERLGTAIMDLCAQYGDQMAETARLRAQLSERFGDHVAKHTLLRTRTHVLDRQEWFQRSVGEAGSSEGWTIEVPETDDAAADLRLLLGMEDEA